jgi:hypothetical protein
MSKGGGIEYVYLYYVAFSVFIFGGGEVNTEVV